MTSSMAIQVLVLEAIQVQQKRKGVSLKAVMKYVLQNMVDPVDVTPQFERSIKKTLIAGFFGFSYGQPILPHEISPYLVYLTPHQVPYQVLRYPQPVIDNKISSAGDSEEIEAESDEDQFEVSQFHSEDEHGRVVFGFQSPDQIRMEARDSDGTVRGSYSYIDANGEIVRMHYWDDGSGFHAAGNNIPVALHQVPEYTPEVQAARDEHFRLYEAALETLQAAMAQSAQLTGDENNDGDYPQQGLSDSDDVDGPSDDTVIIENGVQPEKRPEYPKYPQYIRPTLNDRVQVEDEDKESVAIENPEFRISVPEWTRQGKSEEGQKKISVEKKIDMQPDIDPITKEITGGNRAFFYHFKHLIPVEKGQLDHSPSQSGSVSVKAQNSGGIPVAAVHDSQVSPSQKGSLPNVQIYPVYHHES